MVLIRSPEFIKIRSLRFWRRLIAMRSELGFVPQNSLIVSEAMLTLIPKRAYKKVALADGNIHKLAINKCFAFIPRLTARGMPNPQLDFRKRGMTEYVVSPVSYQNLLLS